MRFATFEIGTPVGLMRRVGVVTGPSALVDVNLAYAEVLSQHVDPGRIAVLADAVVPPDLMALLGNGSRGRDAVDEALEKLGPSASEPGTCGRGGAVLVHSLDEVRLLAPIPRPASLRDCSAYEQHVSFATRGQIPLEWYEIPAYYKGNPEAVVGTGTDIPVPEGARKLDYELEFAVVIGRPGTNVPEQEALGLVAGYTVFNDVSDRSQQFRELKLGLGPAKGKDRDTTNVLGPYLVTRDEWDPAKPNLMTARVNGQEWSRGVTNSIYHPVERIISYISQQERLAVGDVIGAGTVGGGCGLELSKYPTAGDVVELEVEGLGMLRNRWISGSA